jgi:hypothetical protein
MIYLLRLVNDCVRDVESSAPYVNFVYSVIEDLFITSDQ